ncbi:hypothetical protein M758_UG071800 [Ceratodon purpureus]|nr:hypothetical protein M758_UG071800 [Ceratodon purpureus]
MTAPKIGLRTNHLQHVTHMSRRPPLLAEYLSRVPALVGTSGTEAQNSKHIDLDQSLAGAGATNGATYFLRVKCIAMCGSE